MTNKTQPIYFMTWDDVLEGQEVFAFKKSHSSNYYFDVHGNIYTRRGDYLTFTTSKNEVVQSTLNLSDYKYIPVPQDRPKPNIWDEYMVDGKFDCRTMVIDAHGFLMLAGNNGNRKKDRALAAYINHILDEGE